MGMQEHADDLARRRAHASLMGGDEAVARRRGAGRLTARERIDPPWRTHGVMPV